MTVNYKYSMQELEEQFLTLLNDLNHTPSYDELAAKDYALLQRLVRRFNRRYTDVLHYFGLAPRRRTGDGEYGSQKVRALIRAFVQEQQRLITPKDARNKTGNLPTYDTIVRYFASWKAAKEYSLLCLKEFYPHRVAEYDHLLRRV